MMLLIYVKSKYGLIYYQISEIYIGMGLKMFLMFSNMYILLVWVDD